MFCVLFLFLFLFIFYIVGTEKSCITEIMDVHLPIRSPKKSVTPSLHKSCINSIHSGKGQSRWHWHPKGWWFKGPKVKDIIHSNCMTYFPSTSDSGVYNSSTSVYVYINMIASMITWLTS